MKNTVDYFPHDCNHKKTMFIIENKYGNDGYAFWFKLLETLGQTEGHVFDCRNPADWEFLLAKTRVNEDIANSILSTLSNLTAIDPDLWQNRIIWCQNFVDRISDVYTRREGLLPQKPQICEQKPISNDVSDNINRQSKLKEIKEKKNKEKYRDYVFLSHEEYERLCADFDKETIESKIEDLDLYLGTNPVVRCKKYKDHNRVLRVWLKKDGPKKDKKGKTENEPPYFTEFKNPES